MSRRHYSMHAAQANAVITNIQSMDYDQIHDIYGIDIDPEGIVHDETYNQDFNSISDWAEWCVSNDEYETVEHVQGKAYSAIT